MAALSFCFRRLTLLRFEYSILQHIENNCVVAQIIAHQKLDVRIFFLRPFQQCRQIVGDMVSRVQKIRHRDDTIRASFHAQINRGWNIGFVAFHKPDLKDRVLDIAARAQHIDNREHIAVRFRTRTAMNQN